MNKRDTTIIFIMILAVVLIVGYNQMTDTKNNVKVKLETTKGDIVI